MHATDARRSLEVSRRILLVDWPHVGVPRALIGAGFTVFGYSPGGFSAAEVVAEAPAGDDSKSVFPPKREGETGYLVFRKLAAPPASVDLVCVYRPENELEGIIAQHVVPLGAKTLWLQPPVTSGAARRIAAERGFEFVQGLDIAETIRNLGIRKEADPSGSAGEAAGPRASASEQITPP
jgi:hypothetical protein